MQAWGINCISWQGNVSKQKSINFIINCECLSNYHFSLALFLSLGLVYSSCSYAETSVTLCTLHLLHYFSHNLPLCMWTVLLELSCPCTKDIYCKQFHASVIIIYFYVADSTGYAQIYFPVEVHEALERNCRRNFPVADNVIVSMSSKMDVPSPQNSWEALTTQWHATDCSQRNL